MVGKDGVGSGDAGEDWRMLLLFEMDRRRRRLARSSKMRWRAARGALFSSRADTTFRAVLDDASTSVHECGGIGVLPVDEEAEVAKVGCDPASLSIGAGVVVPEGIWEQFKLVAGDGGVGVSPSSSEGLEAKRWGGDEDSEVMPSLSCILRLLMHIS